MKKLLIAAMLGACASLTAVPATAAEKLREVNYLLPAPTNLPAFAPWLIAQHEGYYKEEGLDVNFLTGKGGVDVAKQVGAGNAPVGGALGDTPVIVRANQVPVKAVAVLGAGGLGLFASHESDPIDEPAQFKGKTITTIAYTDTVYYALLGTMHLAGLTRDDAEIQAAGPAGVWQLFAKGEAQAMAAVPDWIVLARQAGAKVHIMDPSKAFASMAQSIVVSDDTIKNDPQFVEKIVRATIRGMKLIMNDVDAAVATYVKAVPQHQGQEAQIKEVFDLYNKYVYANQKVPGLIDVERLKKVQDFYVSQGIVRNAVPLEELYTNQFVEAM